MAQLNRILAFKGLGFSLEQIGTVLNEGLSAEQMRGMLRIRQAQITQQLAEMQNQLLEVAVRLEQIERADQLTAYDVLLKQGAPQLVAIVRAILPSHSSSGQLFGEVYRMIGAHVAEALGPHPGEGGATMVLWYDNEFKSTAVDGAAAFIIRKRIPDRGRMRVEELPATLMAATVHNGSYNTIGQAHLAVINWIDANGYRKIGPDREVYLYNAHPIRLDDPTYVTEIQYPVERLFGGN